MAAGFLRSSFFRKIQSLLTLPQMQESRIIRRRSSSTRSSTSSGPHYLVVGLGNYTMPETRHSIGMAAVNHLADKLGVSFQYDKKLSGLYGITQIDDADVILLKPKLLMNINGRSVVKVASAYKIEARNVILVHDDLDKDLGRYSIKHGGSARGHNGVKSVIGSLMSCEMERFLIGIGRPKYKSEVIDYVLQKFTPAEKEVVKDIVDECSNAIIAHLKSCTSNKSESTKSENKRTTKGTTKLETSDS
ncbi:probable peptidyl-tRNA hydrolase [Actinia tenebrosa]|uniref:peptidyl-tRNA hydrolase n=1 Tax=Actinia tenebrosa TaxID=6105 RepID=A0A6P8HK65_ACTTE|nr:probable peptidyl-tRNA hydrolase [Actinia tenebrosa]